MDGCLCFGDTLESELVIIVSFAGSQRSFVVYMRFLTFPELPPSILVTLELIRSISGRCTRLDAMVDGVVVCLRCYWEEDSLFVELCIKGTTIFDDYD
jgi:hypothetical protein